VTVSHNLLTGYQCLKNANVLTLRNDCRMMDLEVITMASINMSIRTDSELKAQAEAVLSQLGMNMNGTINMFLHQIVRDKAVPLSLSLSSEQAVYADLLHAQAERANGYEGRDARAVLAEMDEIIAAAEDP
jgi:DNA-damage-inducible protein J